MWFWVFLTTLMSFAGETRDCEELILSAELEDLSNLYARIQIVRPSARLSLAAQLKARESELAQKMGLSPSDVREIVLRKVGQGAATPIEAKTSDSAVDEVRVLAAEVTDPATNPTRVLDAAIQSGHYEKARKLVELHNFRATFGPALGVEPHALEIRFSSPGAMWNANVLDRFMGSLGDTLSPTALDLFHSLINTPEVDAIDGIRYASRRVDVVRILLDDLARRYFGTKEGPAVLNDILKVVTDGRLYSSENARSALFQSLEPYIGVMNLNFTRDELTPLGYAVRIGHAARDRSFYDLLLRDSKIDIDLPGKSGLTPLNVAVNESRIELLEDLLRRGANPNRLGPRGLESNLRPRRAYWDSFKVLVKHPNAIVTSDAASDEPVLIDLVANSDYEKAALLIERSDVDVNSVGKAGKTALSVLKEQWSRTGILDQFLRRRISSLEKRLLEKGAR